ncbi:putative transcription factor C2H2 family [Helianthus annuus]|nr:putative transcription factor C2H2 family [Helianthus annuus]
MTGTRQHEKDSVEAFVRANARMIVQHAGENPTTSNQRLYKCKDCNKEYDTFQALGGHRASHRAPKPETPAGGVSGEESGETHSKPKLHECKICKKGFEIGQSLGGHMRKHWRRDADNALVDNSSSSCSSSTVSLSNGEVVFKYDLNLTPHENERIDGVRVEQDSSPES